MADPARDEIIDLHTADLAEVDPKDLRAWVEHVIVHAMMGTPAGHLIDRERFQSLLDTHFDEFFVDGYLDFAPVLAALLRIPGVDEEDVYVGVVSLIGQLQAMRIQMDEPVFRLTALQKAALLDDAYAQTQEAREAFQATRLHQAVKELRRRRLGELLVEEGMIDEQQLMDGLEAQEEMGGRLGSNLVRLGYIDEEQLAAFLGRQLGLPCITRLERISADAVRRVPVDLAQRFEVVPISVNDRELGLAMADPSNLEAIDAISFKTGLRVRPAVAPEVLIQYALARFYGVRTRVRVRRLDLHRAKAGSADLLPGPCSMSLDLLTADIAEANPERPVPIHVGTPADDLSTLAAHLANVTTKEDVMTAVEEFSGRHFATCMIFEVDGTEARARFARGVSQLGPQLSDVRVDVHDHSVFSQVFLQRGLFVGAEPEGEAWLCGVLGIPQESLLNVVPIVEHDRVVALVVGNARRKSCSDPVAEDQTMAHIASTAMSMVSLRRRLLALAHHQVD